MAYVDVLINLIKESMYLKLPYFALAIGQLLGGLIRLGVAILTRMSHLSRVNQRFLNEPCSRSAINSFH